MTKTTKWSGGIDEEGRPFVKPARGFDWCCVADRELAESEDLNNAVLMVAAPDLLAACKKFIKLSDRGERPNAQLYDLMIAAVKKAETTL